MRKHQSLAIAIAVAVSLLLAAAAEVHANGTLVLTGQVSSQKEGLMEGVVIGAKKDGSTMTVNVVSDAKGRFGFPGEKLEPGRYALKIRAAGYDLDGPKTVGRPGKVQQVFRGRRLARVDVGNDAEIAEFAQV